MQTGPYTYDCIQSHPNTWTLGFPHHPEPSRCLLGVKLHLILFEGPSLPLPAFRNVAPAVYSLLCVFVCVWAGGGVEPEGAQYPLEEELPGV